jgi:hypothetical protein
MSRLEQLQEALSHTIKLTKSEGFKTYSKKEQEFFRSYSKELNEEITAEYEAIDFIRRRDQEKEHHE